jgi:molybdate transport system substrate-binding protein
MNDICRRAILGFALLSALVFVATPPSAQAQDKGLVIFAAASMKSALDDIAAAWSAQKGKTPAISYASSGTLAKQIEQGAPADIFISADLQWMDYLDKAKLLKAGTRRNLLGNKLVLIEPADQQTTLKIKMKFDLAGVTGDGKIAVCTVTSCPGGIYAKEALQSLAVWDAVEPKLAQAENIRAALALVARGEAKFGVVYETDAKAEPKVKIVDVFPETTHAPIVYPIAVVAASKNPEAEFFEAFLTSQVAAKIFDAKGFTMLPH